MAGPDEAAVARLKRVKRLLTFASIALVVAIAFLFLIDITS